MKVNITPELVAATYDMLCLTAPFKGWNLPPSDDVQFSILQTRERYGDHCVEGDGHHIRISRTRHKTLRTLIETLAHEMVHMRETRLGVRNDIAHGASFRKLAMQVCRIHGFDPGAF
jgi:hypothetical protein